MLITKKPSKESDQKLTFTKMGAKPKLAVKPGKPGLQNAAGASHVEDSNGSSPQKAAGMNKSGNKHQVSGKSVQKANSKNPQKAMHNLAEDAAMSIVKGKSKSKGK